MATITRTPTGKVTSHTAPKRTSGYTYETTWKVPSEQTKDTNHRAETVHVWMRLVWGNGTKSTKDQRIQVEYTNAIGTTSRSTNFNSFTDNKGKRYTRASFYPLTSRKLTGITSHVRLHNRKGNGAWHDSTITLLVPDKPTLSGFSFSTASGTASVTITAAESTERRDRYDTRYTWVVQVKKSGQAMRTLASETSSFTGATKQLSYDYSAWQRLEDGEYLLCSVTARSRGWAGDSADVTKRFVVAPPKAPTIGAPSVSSTAATGRVTVPVGTALDYAMKTVNGKKERDYSINPVSGVVLQALVDVEYASVSAIPAAEEWDDVAEDDGQCSVLACNVGDVAPSTGNYSYVRLMTYRFVKGVAALRRYSAVKALTRLHEDAPTATDDECSILSVATNADGTSLTVVIGYDRKDQSTRDDSDGTELTWATEPDAWTSTEQPETFDVTWRKATSSGDAHYATWYYTQTVVVRGLEEGVPVYLRARRYKEDDGSFGAYSNTAKATPASAPDSVELSAPAIVAPGSPMVLSWAHSGDIPQCRWAVLTGSVTLASGSGSRETYSIPAARYEPYVSSGAIPVRVEVSCGGDFASSEVATIQVASPPELSLTVGPITAQPVELQLETDTAGVAVQVVVSSDGAGGAYPGGERYQERGDDVWSGTYDLEWSEQEGSYTATLALPEGLDLVDGATYAVAVKAIDRQTTLESEEQEARAIVAWAHQAPAPSGSISVTPSDATDEDGNRTISATIQLVAAEGMDEDDVYDVWRVVPGGAQVVVEGVAQDATVLDPYAPFGNATLAYRVATRTADGDVDWADYPYELLSALVTDGNWLRVDFGEDYLELVDVSLSDRFSKDFEARAHFGERTAQGYFGEALTHTAGMSSAVARVYDQDVIDRIARLNAHMGPCLVRTSDGRCYQASVTASTIGQDRNSGAYVVTIDATEVAMTEFAGELVTEGE